MRPGLEPGRGAVVQGDVGGVKSSNNKYSNDEANQRNAGKGTGVYKPAT